MKKQTFLGIDFLFDNFTHSLGRCLLEDILQTKFNTDLKGRDLTSWLTEKGIIEITLFLTDNESLPHNERFLIRQIKIK